MSDGGANQVLPAQESLAEGKKSGKKPITKILIVVCAIGFAAWWTFFRAAPVSPGDPASVTSVRAVVPLESFTVNLADAEEGRFLRATLALGVDGRVPASGKEEHKSNEAGAVSIAVIRDSILTVLSERKSDDLLKPEGKAALKRDLIDALKRDVPALQAKEIYFTEFLVQR